MSYSGGLAPQQAPTCRGQLPIESPRTSLLDLIAQAEEKMVPSLRERHIQGYGRLLRRGGFGIEHGRLGIEALSGLKDEI